MYESTIPYKAKFKSEADQELWLGMVRNSLTVKEIASLCGYTDRTVRDWVKSRSLLPYDCVSLLAKEVGVPVPNISKVEKYAHTSFAGKKGGLSVIKKYGRIPVDEAKRKEQWRIWWEKDGREHVRILKTKSAHLPKKDIHLAEFIGILLGDGGMNTYQVSVTLHSIDDYEYGVYVQNLITSLFNVVPSVYYRDDVNAFSIVISRKKVVDYLNSLGLVVGNKVRQKVQIPTWVMDSEDYSLACLRGLMDTDGSIYLHKYQVKGVWYKYKKISFSSACKELREDVLTILHRFGSRATCSGTNVRIDSIEDVKRYMNIIGTHNPKHLKRYLK